ncbi:NAD-dependent epimerase/dehydratase family protein [Shewanella sp. FJAT-51649]|uniref:NAD-dependent epimerase/dehydratase family protein n=1 Tax=Shewanella sp. FJAT-51649 TaxID=2864210 RepID=UPI001C65F230|nr:NAD-dependent epimerase/dehydratase family protein [Shewanella sp. FJAT-51649]QYJ72802.1 NAD-dependent epimerase/dehydratase family protein [Shewanella sp. FJAT-51649]
MNILVLGSTGFLGSDFINYCNDMSDINCFFSVRDCDFLECKNSNNIVPLSVLLDKGRAMDWLKTHAIDVLISFLGLAHSKNDDFEHCLDSNYSINRKIFFNAELASVKKIIYISSANVYGYGSHLNYFCISENSPVHPQNNNMRTKVKIENYLINELRTESTVGIVLRIPLVYGHGNKAVGNILSLRLLASRVRFLPFSAFSVNLKSYLSQALLNDVILNAAVDQNDICTGIYNIADEYAISTSQFVRTITENMKPKVYHLYFPKLFFLIFFKIFGKYPLYHFLNSSFVLDVSKAKKSGLLRF